jgi:hypothetical protein
MLRGQQLLEKLRTLAPLERDAWLDRELGIESPPPDEPLPRGAVPYLPCPVDAISSAVVEGPIGRDDELVDLGSGLGRVVLLVHALTGARCRGIELQASLVQKAEQCRARLGLKADEVSFVAGDARDVELTGTVFFLYAPFNGELLRAVLARLERSPRRRLVCAVDVALPALSWLRPRETSNPSLVLYDTGATRAAATRREP